MQLFGNIARGRSTPAAPARLVNLLPEKVVDGGRSAVQLFGFPGMSDALEIGNGPIRGSVNAGDDLYIVSGNTLFRMNPGYAASSVGLLSTSTGPVSMAYNGLEVQIVDGTFMYNYDLSTLGLVIVAHPSAGAAAADVVVFHDSYFIINEIGTMRMWRSASYDGSSWTATDFSSSEYRPDRVTGIISDRYLWAINEHTIEPYYNTATSGFSFRPIVASRVVSGCPAPRTAARFNNTIIMLAQDENGGFFVGQINGSKLDRLSNSELEYKIRQYDTITDAFAMVLQFEGHQFYVLTFPTADHGRGRSFVYDSHTGWWPEAGKYVAHLDDYEMLPWSSAAFFNGRNFVFDNDNHMYTLTSSVYSFGDDTMISELITIPVIDKNGARVFHDWLQVDMETGVGLVTGQGSDPHMYLQASDDGGRSWGNAISSSIGPIGKTQTRCRYTGLGSSYNRCYRLRITDPVKRNIQGMYLQAIAGKA